MNKVENLSISSIIFGVFVISLVVFMTITFESPSKDINSYYQVYLGGERIGLLKDVDGLYDLIDKEQEQIKKEYNVTKVYPPLGLEIQKVLTYKDDLMTPRQIYDEIKDIEPFTIEGYEVSINNDGNIKKFNILNKDDLDIAIRNTVISFVDEKDYDNYLNGVKQEITEEGTEIVDIYFDRNVTIKKAYVSTEDNIITNADELSTYFLFGTTKLSKEYKVKASDTIETIADKNKMGISDFLIANPDIVSENALLAAGQIVNVDGIKPLANIVVESYQTEIQKIKYETDIEYDKSASGDVYYVKTKGKNGSSKVTYATKEINGVAMQTKLVSEETIEQPVNKVIVLGGKNIVYYGNSTYWAWPTSKPFRISDEYGWRIHPIRHEPQFHGAIDITGVKNRNLYAVQSGKVIVAAKSGYNGGAGKYVKIDHQNGYKTTYMHMAKVYVSKGDTVTKGQVIGVMGTTGSSTGVHLHFAVEKNGQVISPWKLYK